MLFEGSNFRIGGLDSGAGVGGQAHLGRVALQRAVDEGSSHSRDVTCSFGVCEGLVGRRLLKAFHIGDLP